MRLKEKKHFRLRPWNMYVKILFLCTSSILAALFLLAGLFSYRSADMIYEQSKQSSILHLRRLQDDVSRFVGHVEDTLISVYNDDDLINDMVSHMEYREMKEKHFRAAFTLAQNFSAEDGVVAVYFYDDFNRLFSSYRHASTPIYHYPENPLQEKDSGKGRLQLFLMKEPNTMLISGYDNENRDTVIFRFAVNIFSQDGTNNQIGAVVCDIDSKVLVQMLEKYIQEDGNLLWLQPSGDMVLAEAGKTAFSYAEDAMQAISFGADNQELQQHVEGHVLFCAPVDPYNLTVYSLMPQTLLLENQKAISNSLFIIAVFMVLLFAFISNLFARGMTRPLSILTSTMRRIQEGETQLRVQDLGSDEIGELGGTFNQMIDRVEYLLAQEYEMKLSLQRAQYNALQAQINPHFLYNTLDTMGSIAQIKGCDEVSELSESLSRIFHYTLDMSSSFATLERELIHLKNYIYVMDVRMHNQIRYVYQIDETLLSCMIPKLMLQPLVENAISHGVRNVRREKRISITVTKDADDLVIAVSDNGIGMDVAVFQERLKHWSQEDVNTGKSIGLMNIHARLQTLYGSDYGVSMESIPHQETTVCLRVPIQEVAPNGI